MKEEQTARERKGVRAAAARFFFLLPLWEKVARAKPATDEGLLATALAAPSPVSAGARPPSPTGAEGRKQGKKKHARYCLNG